MPRPPRPQYAGATYHVTTRGVRASTIFVDDGDRRAFAAYLRIAVGRHGWRCHAWCLLGTHYHLLLTTPDPNLARGMHQVNSRFASWFNGRHDFAGHVFQGRYHALVVASESHLLELYRYIALNPVRAGLVERPEDWPWSSYRFELDLGPTPGPATHLDHFERGEKGRAALRAFVDVALAGGA